MVGHPPGVSHSFFFVALIVAHCRLRDLTRQRIKLVRERASIVNRLQKVLEGANIKLASVVTDVLGVSARAMLEALLAGTNSPAEMADLAQSRLRQKLDQLEEALEGRMPTFVAPTVAACGRMYHAHFRTSHETQAHIGQAAPIARTSRLVPQRVASHPALPEQTPRMLPSGTDHPQVIPHATRLWRAQTSPSRRRPHPRLQQIALCAPIH
jgi:hypothetical protein